MRKAFFLSYGNASDTKRGSTSRFTSGFCESFKPQLFFFSSSSLQFVFFLRVFCNELCVEVLDAAQHGFDLVLLGQDGGPTKEKKKYL